MSKLSPWAKVTAVAATLTLITAVPATASTAFVVPGTKPFTTIVGPGTGDGFNSPLLNSKWYDYADSTITIVDYPRAWYPLTSLDDPTFGYSVTTGTDMLVTMVKGASGQIVVTALSQGAIVVDRAQGALAGDPDAPDPLDISFIIAGDPSRSTPVSNGLFSYFPNVFIPIMDYQNARPTDTPFHTTVVVGEYDGGADFPDRPWNLLATLNALAGIDRIHASSAFADPAVVPASNVFLTTNSVGGTTTTYLVPTARLPLVGLLIDLGLPGDVAGLLNAVLKPLVDAGYSRNDGPLDPRPYLTPTAGLPRLTIGHPTPPTPAPAVVAAPMSIAPSAPPLPGARRLAVDLDDVEEALPPDGDEPEPSDDVVGQGDSDTGDAAEFTELDVTDEPDVSTNDVVDEAKSSDAEESAHTGGVSGPATDDDTSPSGSTVSNATAGDHRDAGTPGGASDASPGADSDDDGA